MKGAVAIAQVALVALLAAAQLAGAQPPRPGPGFRNFVENLSKVVAAEGSEFFKAPAATVQTVVCGESTLAVFVQIVGGSCNVTTEQTSNAGASKQGPRACSAGEIFPGKACTAMPGALTITVTPGANQKGLVKSETEPDLAGAISQLGLSGLSALGALSVDVLFGDFVHVQSLALLPSLQRITGVPAAAAAVTGLPQPIMSQLRITGGLGTSSPHSFASVAFQPMEINGMLQVTATALTSLDSFAQLQTVAGDMIVTNNNDLASMFTSNIVKLQTIGGGLNLAFNQKLQALGAPMTALTSIGMDRSAGSLLPNGLTVVSNPQLTSFKGLDALSSLGGGLLVVNNSALASLEGLNALGALNATGAASLHGPKVLGLDAIKLSPPSVLVTGNPALADVSALARLAGCASGDPSGTTGIVLEVHPADQGLKCTLVAWKQVCDYIAAGNKVPSDSLWRNNGVCLPA